MSDPGMPMRWTASTRAVEAFGPLTLAANAVAALEAVPKQQLDAAIGRSVRNVLAFGADPTGVTECSAAFIAACQSNTRVYIPPGTYKVNPFTLSGINNLWLDGAGAKAANIVLNSGGAAITLSNCQDYQITNLAFYPALAFPASSGIIVTLNSGNGTIDHCWIYNFTQYGIGHTGDSGNQMSGNRVSRCCLLSNLVAGVYMKYSNDYWIEGNQFGILQSSYTPAAGASLNQSGAGTYTNNYHWNNTNNLYMTDCSHMRIENNRIEEALQTAIIATACYNIIFTGNHSYGNSKSASGTYNGMNLSGCGNWLIADNQFYDWTGGSAQTAVGIAIVNCNKIGLSNNLIRDCTVAPITLDSHALVNDLTVDYQLIGVTSTPVGAGTVTFLGAAGSNSFYAGTCWPIFGAGFAAFMFVSADVAPGAGQSNTYVFRKNGVDTAMAISVADGVFGGYVAANGVSVVNSDSAVIKLTTSATAAPARHNYVIGIVKA